MSTPSVKLSVLVCKKFACIKIAGRANFTSSPDFKALLTGLIEKGYAHFIIDLAECVLMDSTFLGVLAQFGMKMSPANNPGACGIELLNAPPRITELLENLGVLHLFNVINGPLQLPDDTTISTPESVNPNRVEITRTCLEAHKTLMALNPENEARFKDVTKFLAEDLKYMENRS
ncbi:MAG: STAS domain-containing protein [Limisphaerales bacterium]